MNNHHLYRSLALTGVVIAMCVAPSPAIAATPVWNLAVNNGQAFGLAFADPNTSVPGSFDANVAFNQLLPGFIDANNIAHDFGNSDTREVGRAEPNAVNSRAAATITADGQLQPVLHISWSSDGSITSSSTGHYTVGAEVFSGATLLATVSGAAPELPVAVYYQWTVQASSSSIIDTPSGFDDRSLTDATLRVRTPGEQNFVTLFDLGSASQPHLGPPTLDESGSGEFFLPPGAASLEISLAGTVMNNIAPPLNAGADAGSSAFTASITFSLVPPPMCAGDANNDNRVNSADLSVLLAQFNQTVAAGEGADFNQDAVVNGADLSILLSNFGNPCF